MWLFLFVDLFLFEFEIFFLFQLTIKKLFTAKDQKKIKRFEDTNYAPVADGIDALIVDDVVIACAVIVTAGGADDAGNY